MSELKPCPFCGNTRPYFERTGTPRHSCIVVCGNCGCQHESSDENEHSGSSWNERDDSELTALRNQVVELQGKLDEKQQYRFVARIVHGNIYWDCHPKPEGVDLFVKA